METEATTEVAIMTIPGQVLVEAGGLEGLGVSLVEVVVAASLAAVDLVDLVVAVLEAVAPAEAGNKGPKGRRNEAY